MKAENALARMTGELRQLVQALNSDGEYEYASKAQIALIAVSEINPLEVEIPGFGAEEAELLLSDRNHLVDAVRWLREVPSSNPSKTNAALTAQYLQEMIARIPARADA